VYILPQELVDPVPKSWQSLESCERTDVRQIIKEGGHTILIGQLMAYQSNVDSNLELFEMNTYDRESNTYSPLYWGHLDIRYNRLCHPIS
jgi:hypothetical protein